MVQLSAFCRDLHVAAAAANFAALSFHMNEKLKRNIKQEEEEEVVLRMKATSHAYLNIFTLRLLLSVLFL